MKFQNKTIAGRFCASVFGFPSFLLVVSAFRKEPKLQINRLKLMTFDTNLQKMSIVSNKLAGIWIPRTLAEYFSLSVKKHIIM